MKKFHKGEGGQNGFIPLSLSDPGPIIVSACQQGSHLGSHEAAFMWQYIYMKEDETHLHD